MVGRDNYSRERMLRQEEDGERQTELRCFGSEVRRLFTVPLRLPSGKAGAFFPSVGNSMSQGVGPSRHLARRALPPRPICPTFWHVLSPISEHAPGAGKGVVPGAGRQVRGVGGVLAKGEARQGRVVR